MVDGLGQVLHAEQAIADAQVAVRGEVGGRIGLDDLLVERDGLREFAGGAELLGPLEIGQAGLGVVFQQCLGRGGGGEERLDLGRVYLEPRQVFGGEEPGDRVQQLAGFIEVSGFAVELGQLDRRLRLGCAASPPSALQNMLVIQQVDGVGGLPLPDSCGSVDFGSRRECLADGMGG